MEVFVLKIKIFFYNMSYSYLYVGKVDVKINTLPYFNKIESVYTSSNTLKNDIFYNAKYYGINTGSNNFNEVWNSFSTSNITLKAQIIYYIYMKESFNQVFTTSSSYETSTTTDMTLSDSSNTVNNSVTISSSKKNESMEENNESIYISKKIKCLTKSHCDDITKPFNVKFERNSILDSIEEEAFKNCNIFIIVLPTNLREIENQTFINCSMLKSIIFEDNSQLEKIGAQAFVNANMLNEITIPSYISELKTGLFNGCNNLSNITFENTLTRPSRLRRIENFVFNGTNIKLLHLPQTIEYLSNYSLQGLKDANIFISKHSSLELKETTHATLYGGKNITIKYYN